VRYIDRFEIRKGASFETVKWGMPSLLQEKLILGGAHAYLVTTKGQIKSYDLATGQLEWQRDAQAVQLTAFGDALFATTYAQTVVCFDARGNPQWSYEYGWDREPTLLPNEEWLVLHYPDGRRIKLNRELLRVTGNADGFKFLDYRAREAEKDWKGALGALSKVLALEPGNGQAWRLRANALRLTGAPRAVQSQALVEAARSQATPAWSNGPVLKSLAAGLGANWVWKRQYGPKFYPNLVPHREWSFYLENDNQTLVLLNHETGDLVNSFRFSEELDMKVALWKNDTLCVSSPSRLYLLSPASGSGGLGQFPLKNPVCQAQALPGGLIYSDWYGGLSMMGLPDRTTRWERQLGQSGLYLGKSKNADYLDVVDLEGKYFAVQPASGKVLWQARLPPGTITETFSNKDFIYAGYSQGTLVAIDRARQAIAWTVDFGEQIFSLSGNRDNTLVLTTASKKLICVQAQTGAILSQVRIQSYLFNRPTVIDHGYWLGTTEPALEKRNFNHELILKYKLPDLPGSPILFGNSVFIGTLDDFILSFPD
jgi:outer membrane protein assembly factor BamB